MKKQDSDRRAAPTTMLTPRQRALVAAADSQRLADLLARRIARAADKFGMGLDELLALAAEALVAAAVRFDATRGVPFTAFARPRVRAALLRAVRTAVKQRRLMVALFHVAERMQLPAAGIDGDLPEAIEVSNVLAAAVAQLPVDHARIVEGYYFEGMTMTEVARELGKSTAVTYRLHQDALARLRHQLRLRGLPRGKW